MDALIDFWDRVYHGDARAMRQLPDECVCLVFCSPPYNQNQPYDGYDDNQQPLAYEALLRDAWAECQRVLRPGGRLVVNVANTGRKPYVRLTGLVDNTMAPALVHRGEIIWDKGAGVGSSGTGWGSWRRPSNPSLRDRHEYLLVYQKGPGPLAPVTPDSRATVSAAEFTSLTSSVWSISPAPRHDHPAPFPVALAERVIRLYAWSDSLVLDPFAGTGNTLVAAKKLGRRYVGYEISEHYAQAADARLLAQPESLFVLGGDEPPPPRPTPIARQPALFPGIPDILYAEV